MAVDLETREKIIAMTKDGLTRQGVANELHISRNAVCGIVQKHIPDRDKDASKCRVVWTLERLAELRRLAEHKTLTQAQIAIRMGVSHRSIRKAIFKYCRELTGTFPMGSPGPKGFRLPKQGAGRGVTEGGMGAIIARSAAALAAYVPPPAEPPTPTMCDTMALTNTTCRFPLSGDGAATLYCGSDDGADLALGKPYCRWHAGRCFVPVSQRRAA